MNASAGTRRTGIALAAVTAVISGFSVFINGFGVKAWAEVTSATAYTTLKNVVAALLLAGLAAMAARRSSDARARRPRGARQWLGLGAIAVLGGSVPFVMFFEGFARASSVQATLIHKTLVIWVAVLAVMVLKEKIGLPHIAAIGLLFAGQALFVGGFGDVVFGTGELLMLGATLLWSIEVVIAKRLLADLSPSTVGLARMVGGGILLVAYAAVSGAFAGMGAIGLAQIGWILLTGLFLAGYVASWYLALSKAPAVDVTAVLVGAVVITAFLRSVFNGAALPSPIGLVLVTAGVGVALVANRRVGQVQAIGSSSVGR